jgi:hypothetical protein
MKKALLILGICICGLLGIAKIWGLIFLQFSVKQTVYVFIMLGAALAMFFALREAQPPSDKS